MNHALKCKIQAQVQAAVGNSVTSSAANVPNQTLTVSGGSVGSGTIWMPPIAAKSVQVTTVAGGGGGGGAVGSASWPNQQSAVDKLKEENEILNAISDVLHTRINEIHVGTDGSFHVFKFYEEDTLLIKMITDPLEASSIEYSDYFNLCKHESRLKQVLANYAKEFNYVRSNPDNSKYICIIPLNNTVVEEEMKDVKDSATIENIISERKYNTFI